jgi:hypothetical protein
MSDLAELEAAHQHDRGEAMIVTATPTIMDGLVIRWYASERAEDRGSEVMSASRNGVRVYSFLHEVPAAHMANAVRAYEYLRADRPGCEDFARSLATHRRSGMFGPLEPVAAHTEEQG